jgi:hypothetical protein
MKKEGELNKLPFLFGIMETDAYFCLLTKFNTKNNLKDEKVVSLNYHRCRNPHHGWLPGNTVQ